MSDKQLRQWRALAAEAPRRLYGPGYDLSYIQSMMDALQGVVSELDATIQRAKAAEADCAVAMQQWDDWKRRAQAAEAALAAVPVEDITVAIADIHERERVQQARRSVRDWLDKHLWGDSEARP